jgi:hypothetical protein
MTSGLQHTRIRPLIGRGFIDPAMIPLGQYDDGMIRLASIAQASGRALAKVAGMGSIASMAASAGKLLPKTSKGIIPARWKGQLALGAAGVGAAYVGTKAVGAGLKALSHEGNPKNYGAGNFQIPQGINEYGQPQLG